MENTVASHLRNGNRRSNGTEDPHEDSGKYMQFTAMRVEVFEKVFAENPKPTFSYLLEMMHNHAILLNLESKQIKVWFQNCRGREKQKREATDLQRVNKILIATNKVLMDEYGRLQKQVFDLESENEYLRQQLKSVCSYHCRRLPLAVKHLQLNK